MFNPFTEFPVLSIIAVILLIQVVTFFTVKAWNQMGKEVTVKGELISNLILLPTIIIFLIFSISMMFVPTKENRKDWANAKQAKKRAKDFEKETRGLTDRQLKNLFTRRRIKEDMGGFQQFLSKLDPNNPLWKVSLEKEQLPHDLNVLLQIVIDVSTEFAFLEKNTTPEESDLLEERTNLELCFEKMRELLVDHAHLHIDHAEDFMIDEIASAMREADFYATEETNNHLLRNPAYEYFSLAWKKDDESVDTM